MDDSALMILVERARTGDGTAAEALFHACYRDLRVFASARLRGAADETDEVVQATFLTALGGLDGFRGDGSFQGWLRGIAANKIAHLRRDQSRLKPLAGELGDLLLSPVEDGPQGEAADLAQRLPACLERLSPAARQLVERRWVAREALQDIAGSLGRSANALSVSLHRIRTALRACLEASHGR